MDKTVHVTFIAIVVGVLLALLLKPMVNKTLGLAAWSPSLLRALVAGETRNERTRHPDRCGSYADRAGAEQLHSR